MPAWLSMLLILCSLSIVIYGLFFFDRDFDPDDLPAGWLIINPPGDVNTISISGDTVYAGGKNGVYCISRINKNVIGKLSPDTDVNYVKSLFTDNEKKLWIGHANGLTTYINGEFTSSDESDGLPDKRVNTIIQTKNGCIMAGTWKGAVCLKSDKIEILDKKSGLIDDMVNIMYEDSRGNLWLGSYTAPRGGISILRDNMVQTFDTESGLPHNNITSIAEDSAGNIWVGTGLYKRGGAARFHLEKGKWIIDSLITYEDGLPGEKVRSLYIDRNFNTWFGTEYEGLAVFHRDHITILSKDNGLSHPEIKCILQDENDNFWIGTRDGLNYIEKTVVDSLLRINNKQ